MSLERKAFLGAITREHGAGIAEVVRRYIEYPGEHPCETRIIPHGTGSGYSYHRCRCDRCKAYASNYQRRKRARTH